MVIEGEYVCIFQVLINMIAVGVVLASISVLKKVLK